MSKTETPPKDDPNWKPVEPATDAELELWLTPEGWKDFEEAPASEEKK